MEWDGMGGGLLEEDDGFEPPSPGAVMKLVGRRCGAVLEGSETEVLVEGFDEWRRDHAKRTLQLDTLAPLRQPFNCVVVVVTKKSSSQRNRRPTKNIITNRNQLYI